ncbi:hypothetical protein SDC9_132595 [bioreactor metagenome]|uniref:Uncharacterized protein n=1 Tax=bioreactor metagenome TaxID=1076179 RepID=A0A645D838_9ZZZZ
MDALAHAAEGVGRAQLRVCRERRSLGDRVHAQHAQIARHLMHGKRAGGRLRIQQNLAAIRIDQLARHACGLLRLALRVADHHLDLAPTQSARGVELFHLQHHCIARGDAQRGNAP